MTKIVTMVNAIIERARDDAAMTAMQERIARDANANAVREAMTAAVRSILGEVGQDFETDGCVTYAFKSQPDQLDWTISGARAELADMRIVVTRKQTNHIPTVAEATEYPRRAFLFACSIGNASPDFNILENEGLFLWARLLSAARKAYEAVITNRRIEEMKVQKCQVAREEAMVTYRAEYEQYLRPTRLNAAHNKRTLARWRRKLNQPYTIRTLEIGVIYRDDEEGPSGGTESRIALGAEPDTEGYWTIVAGGGRTDKRKYAYIAAMGKPETWHAGDDGAPCVQLVYLNNNITLLAPPGLMVDAAPIENALRRLPCAIQPPEPLDFATVEAIRKEVAAALDAEGIKGEAPKAEDRIPF